MALAMPRLVLRRIVKGNGPRRYLSRHTYTYATRATTDAETQRELDRIDELVQRSVTNWEVETTRFHSPLVWSVAVDRAKVMADVRMVALGGYPNAERRIVVVGREESMMDVDESSRVGLVALQCTGNFLFDRATHPDFLGAALGTGIERWNIGDILVSGEDGATIICLESIAEHLTSALVQVRSVPVQTRKIDWSEIRIPEQRTKEVKTVEASLRIDAIASAGYGCSRAKASQAIKEGAVKVNWQVVTKPSALVDEGACLSWQKKGRLTVERVETIASKGGGSKYVLNLKRYY
jgi:photosystem II S4 domain protein